MNILRHTTSSIIFTPARLVFMAGEQLQSLQGLESISKDNEAVAASLTQEQIDAAAKDAGDKIDAYEKKLKEISKSKVDSGMGDETKEKAKNKNTIDSLKAELGALKKGLKERMKAVKDKKETDEKTALEKGLNDATNGPDDFASFMKEQDVELRQDTKNIAYGYFQAMFALGKGKDALKNIKNAHAKGGTDIDDYVTKKSLSAATGVPEDLKDFDWLKGTLINTSNQENNRIYTENYDFAASFMAAYLKEAQSVLGGDTTPEFKVYKLALGDALTDNTDLAANKEAYKKSPSLALLSEERILTMRILPTPKKWKEAHGSEIADAATTTTPENSSSAAPETKNFVATATDLLAEATRRGNYVGTINQYVAHWDEMFGAGKSDGGFTKEAWIKVAADVTATNPDGSFNVAADPAVVEKFTKYMADKVHSTYIQKLEECAIKIGLVYVSDLSQAKSGSPEAKFSDPSYVGPQMSRLNSELAKLSPEAQEKGSRELYAKKLNTFVERMNLQKGVLTDTQFIDRLIAEATDQSTKVLDQNDGKYTVLFHPDRADAYLNKFRDAGKNLSISCAKNLRDYAKKYTQNADLAMRCEDCAKKFDLYATQQLEDTDLDKFTDSLRFYKEQVDLVRTFEGRDTIDKEREDFTKFPDTAEELEARAKATDAGVPFLNRRQAEARGYLYKDPTNPAKAIPLSGYEWVDNTEPLNLAVKFKDIQDTPDEAAARAAALASGMEFKNRREAIKAADVVPNGDGKWKAKDGYEFVDSSPLNLAVKPKVAGAAAKAPEKKGGAPGDSKGGSAPVEKAPKKSGDAADDKSADTKPVSKESQKETTKELPEGALAKLKDEFFKKLNTTGEKFKEMFGKPIIDFIEKFFKEHASEKIKDINVIDSVSTTMLFDDALSDKDFQAIFDKAFQNHLSEIIKNGGPFEGPAAKIKKVDDVGIYEVEFSETVMSVLNFPLAPKAPKTIWWRDGYVFNSLKKAQDAAPKAKETDDPKKPELPPTAVPELKTESSEKSPEPTSTIFFDGVPEALKARYDKLTPNEKDTYRQYVQHSKEAHDIIGKQGVNTHSNRGMGSMDATIFIGKDGKPAWVEGRHNLDSAKTRPVIKNLNEWYLSKIEAKRPSPEQIKAKFLRQIDEKMKQTEAHASQWDLKGKNIEITYFGNGFDIKKISDKPSIKFIESTESTGPARFDYYFGDKKVTAADARASFRNTLLDSLIKDNT